MAELAEREHSPGQAGSGNGPRYGRAAASVRWLVIAVPVAVAFASAGADLSGPSLWRDEAYTKDAISRSLSHLFTLLAHTDAVHGAYYVLMHFVAAAIGTSGAALRFPSLCAMAVATGFTAAIGRRAAVLAGNRWPEATGLLAGLLFAVAPYMTYYAQMARSYAFVTMFVALSSYLLLRAAGPAGPAAPASPDGGGWRWWCGYGVAVAFCGLFNTFALLILPAHALTLLFVAPRARVAVPWLVASLLSVAALVPLLLVSFGQRAQIAWLPKPDLRTLTTLASDLAGAKALVAPMALLAFGGVLAGILDGRRLSPAAIALPWLAVPIGLLLAISVVKPVYSPRYIEFCLPALAILAATGLVGLARLVATTPLGRAATPLGRAGGLAWVPSAVILVLLAVLLIAPQRAIRQSSARPDNLRLAAQIVAANERPGDVVFYMPANMYVLGTGYPAPFLRLRNIGLGESPVATGTLTGTEVSSPAVLASRFTGVTRVWVVTGAIDYKFPAPGTAVDKEKMALIAGAGLHIVHRWQAGETMLTLYSK